MPSQPDSPGDLEVGELLVNAVVSVVMLSSCRHSDSILQPDTHIDKYDIIDKF